MKFFDYLPIIIILVLVSVLGYFGYKVYSDYEDNKDKAAPGTTPGSASAGSFGAYIDDSLFSIGTSSQDVATAQTQVGTNPVGSVESILGIGCGYGGSCN
jgi:hypothetical protein